MNYKKRYFIYILSSGKNDTIYIGITNNLIQRINQHKNKEIKGFTEKYSVTKLVYYEIYGEVSRALYREKQLKNWHRPWKIDLIEKNNPSWKCLLREFLDTESGFRMTLWGRFGMTLYYIQETRFYIIIHNTKLL